ncbi:DUF72 domain-containing protein [Daejeonella sp. JGW-45]|uniref:DUF72 domain-containing protein n=1 Tax=Daejeonella sp. JGW-45 TaxID=3034148 RepID=UPI0023EAE122|nr:DUF72 domain-containing protein [Daejeonella sp. JGW-45]
MEFKSSFFSGTSGMVLPVPNKSAYPPEFQGSSRLRYYGHLFNSLEVNSSFYKVPMPSTVDRWAAEVPVGFRFTYKLWRDITHVRDLLFKDADVHRFMQVIKAAGDKKGCLLVQFPPGLQFGALRQLERLLMIIREADPDEEWTLSIEFRKLFWYTEAVHQMLENYGAGIVLHDKAGSQTDFIDQDGSSVYLRFHGPGGNYRGSYTDDFLYEYSSYIRAWIEEGKTVYAYFNNTMGDAVNNLITLNNFVSTLGR